ncbi:MAG: microcin C ABC transporter permease YejB [Roseiarcus sp.]|jgi:microcin C transport system permease protein|uniref:microcin C ABC transporter permease YejB n=1 Tax=Roseiarcus sp. TaxID=1969460 RepID=UPI003C1CA4F2
MLAYILRRLLLMIPTVFGIVLVSFAIVQFVPGGPVERVIAQLQGADEGSTARIGGGGGQIGAGAMARAGGDISSRYRGAQGLDPKFIKELEKQYGFDKPPLERFWMLVRDYATFNLGRSYYRDAPVVELIKEKLPVSMSLGLWMTLISYAISIPLGVRKAVKDGSRFDTWTSALVIFGYAIPSFLFAILLVVLFCGGSFWQIFPLRGLTSDNFADFSWPHKVLDYLWHITLPVASLVLGSFATSTLLTKNSFLDEIKKSYVQTARMKGLSERRVLYGHVFRNAMLIVIAGFPGAFLSAFFTGSLLIEQVFSLDGLGYLSYDSLIQRDYPVVLGNLYVFALLGMVTNLISDLTYTWVDPRIDFETREV